MDERPVKITEVAYFKYMITLKQQSNNKPIKDPYLIKYGRSTPVVESQEATILTSKTMTNVTTKK